MCAVARDQGHNEAFFSIVPCSRTPLFCAAAGSPDANYSAFEGHDLHVVPSAATLTFEHSYTWWGNRRKLRVAARPNVTLSAQHVPARCRRARTVLLGPLTPDDVDCLSFIQQPGTFEIPAATRRSGLRRSRLVGLLEQYA